MLRLPDVWTWDFWTADDGERFHLFFLKASRALLDPDRRHWRASVGHAVSMDLREWEVVEDALVADDGPSFDDLATWTGSVVQRDDGRWLMFYTGVERASEGRVQRISVAESEDLIAWHRANSPVLEADSRWYEKEANAQWREEAWRDPWVFRHDGKWHMLITARAQTGEGDQRGVVGYATSEDLSSWTAQPPLSDPGAGFGHLEVLQVAEVDGRHVLVFSCLAADLSSERREAGEKGGVWAVNIDSPIERFNISEAYRLTGEELYAGRLVQDRDGRWHLLAFHHDGPGGRFVGGLSDPMPVTWRDDGRLSVVLDG